MSLNSLYLSLLIFDLPVISSLIYTMYTILLLSWVSCPVIRILSDCMTTQFAIGKATEVMVIIII